MCKIEPNVSDLRLKMYKNLAISSYYDIFHLLQLEANFISKGGKNVK